MKCKVDGCNTKIKSRGYCERHYKQVMLFGHIKRTMNDPNEIVIKDDHAEVILYDSFGIEKTRTLIDIEDINLIKQYKWSDKEGYVYTKPNRKSLSLHRLIMDAPKGSVVDHINHDTLDNRKSNLRICTVQQNNWNSKNAQGVYYRADRDKWRAGITKNGKSIYLGLYEDKNDAKKARRNAEIKYYGEFAPKKEIDSE